VNLGRSLTLFPEGTRSRDDAFLPFKKGGALIALRSGRPLVPVALSGTNALMPKDAKLLRPGRVVVTVLPPIPTEGLSLEARDRLTEQVFQAIQGAYIPAARLQQR
jgi:1-acyl-sn-glycerol-3-phosphate acyltransferase